MLAFLGNLNGWEIPVIIFIVLLLFGGKKLPELARGAGRAIKEFRSATSEAENTFREAMDSTAPENNSRGNQKEPAKTEPAQTAGTSERA
ncbi:MAG: twin-arginine translocase TatA/TatE family subunit [Opitutales bacterium]